MGATSRASATSGDTPRVRRHLEDRARVFTIGLAYGFVAGVFAVTLLVWRFGDVVQRRPVETVKPRASAEATIEDKSDAATASVQPPPAAATSGRANEAASAAVASSPPAELAGRDLHMPVDGVQPQHLTPQFDDARGGRRHEAIDILAPRGTPVRAVEDGRIARLFFSKAGGTTIYQFDPSESFSYYYAHLDRYAPGLRENDRVKRGQVIGYVGTTGNAPPNTPHLHFAIFRLTNEKRWWEGTPIDPYDILR